MQIPLPRSECVKGMASPVLQLGDAVILSEVGNYSRSSGRWRMLLKGAAALSVWPLSFLVHDGSRSVWDYFPLPLISTVTGGPTQGLPDHRLQVPEQRATETALLRQVTDYPTRCDGHTEPSGTNGIRSDGS